MMITGFPSLLALSTVWIVQIALLLAMVIYKETDKIINVPYDRST